MDWIRKRSSLKILFIVVMCLSLCGTVGCKKEEQEKTAEEGFCTDISVFDCQQGLSFCDKGMVKVEEGLIMFYEYETGRSYPLCSDAYCEHIPYDSRTNPDPVCEATAEELRKACIYGDYVYIIQETGIQEITVQVRDLKESGYRMLATLPYCQTFSAQGYNAIIGDKAYLLLAEIDNLEDDGIAQSYTSNDLYTYLVELDLKTGEYKTLFHIDGEEKYKILQTVYGKEGVYCRCYYEDIEMSEDYTNFTVNDYREAFYYIAYDGSEVKELCQELVEMTAFGAGELPKVMVSGINERGAFLPDAEGTKVEYYRFDGEKETAITLPEGYERLSVNGVGEDFLLLTFMTPEKTYETVGFDLTTKQLIAQKYSEYVNYSAVYDGAFWKYCSDETGEYRELWMYKDIFSEAGKPLLSVRE